MKKITAIYGSTYKDLERENKKLKQMIQKDRIEVLQEMEKINNQYLTELFIRQNKINKAIKYIKENTDNTNFIEVPSIELLEILEDKETEEIPLFEGTLEQLNNLSILGDKQDE